MPEERRSTVSNETVDNVDNETSFVALRESLPIASKEVNDVENNNHPDPIVEGSIVATEEDKIGIIITLQILSRGIHRGIYRCKRGCR